MTFPPGRARLAMSPSPTGTIGIVPVAFLAAAVVGVATATMMSTLSRTSSAARSGSRSNLASADR